MASKPEFIMAAPDNQIGDHFEHQAIACDRLGSPFTGSLCRALIRVLDDTTQTGRRVLSWPGNPRWDALALRLCGGLHGLVLTRADAALSAVYPPSERNEDVLAAILPGAIARNDSLLSAALDNAPQTNETARSAMLLPGFLTIARETGLPLALNEIGSSAGLNMLFDRFHYVYGKMRWGDALSEARLTPEVTGRLPPLDGALEILSRQGCDIAPVHLTDEVARLRLRSYVWADQTDRLKRLDAAVSIAERVEFSVETMNAAAFLRRQLAAQKDGAAFVLFHSIMWQYMPEREREEIRNLLKTAGRNATSSAPIAWLRMEPVAVADPFATLSLTLWPGGKTRRLARCDFHGRSIEWLG
ncbi:DUF2332 family protein [Corticibacterium sp. UT-5YL-CI-8]|nr:DUF2332 family protein [Tianweitania sp. UT-5YL-CI-8]